MNGAFYMHTHMNAAFKEAAKADNKVGLNPKVGAIIIKNDRVISTGYHAEYGHAHAEINALNNAKEPVEGSTMVVTLEPCSHHGKTPPCVDAIQASGIQKVIIGTLDPNPHVAGRGMQILKDAGLEVELLDATDQQQAINRDYLKKVTTGRPYVTLKSAVSLDGKMALKNGESQWITSPESRDVVQALRRDASAVLVGVGTILKDNPRLTVRGSTADSPVRIILDSHLRTPLDSTVVQTALKVDTWIFTGPTSEAEAFIKAGVKVFHVPLTDDHCDLDAVFDQLNALPLKHILVESGPTLTTALIHAQKIDEWRMMMAPTLLGADALSLIKELTLSRLIDSPQFQLRELDHVAGDIHLTLIPERTS